MGASGDLEVGIDIGGTFTDLCVLGRDGIVGVGKTLTTSAEPAAGVASILRDTVEHYDIDPANIASVVHGTTLVTNALIERRGASTALLATAGFRDVVEMRREHRYELYDLDLDLPDPLVPRWLRFDVPERVRSDGSVSLPLDKERVAQLARELDWAGIDAVGISFLHSHTNPAHELQAREVMAEYAPNLRVSLSSEVNPELREYERTSTTLANVYVQRLAEDYLQDLHGRLTGLGIRRAPQIMLSNGGIATIETAQRFPIRMLESGPAAGALGAVAFGRQADRVDQLAFDMGGTTAKACVIEDSRPLVTHEFEVDRVYRLKPGSGLPVRAPVIDMIEIGAGGGSIARINQLGLVTVGPDSAGSEPGPVCYGRGGSQCTVTDADLVLGYLEAGYFLGGSMHLDVEAAAQAITQQIAEPMGISLAEAAWGIHATVNANMADAARIHVIERGQDPTTLPVFVMGGNGPVHGPNIAVSLGSGTVISPPVAGVLSAAGLLSAPFSIDFVRSWHAALDTIGSEAAHETFIKLERESETVLGRSGVEAHRISHEHSLDMRFVGQGNEIEVSVPPVAPGWHDQVKRAFTNEYQLRFGSTVPRGVGIEILTWRVTSKGPDPEAHLHLSGGTNNVNPRTDTRRAYFRGNNGYVDTPVYDRYRLSSGSLIEGPALVQERESTLVLSPGMRGEVTSDGSIVITLKGNAND